MGLLGCPASFQGLMEGVLRNLQNVIVYSDDLLIHSDTHERHLQILEQVLERLQQNHLKLNLEKCIFGNKEVGLCNFFRTQIKDFAVIAAPLFRLTRTVSYTHLTLPTNREV